MAKGVVPAALSQIIWKNQHGQDIAVFSGLAAVLGHTFSPFLKFKGGKGVATGIGAILCVSPTVAAYAILIFVVFMAFTQIVSLSSIVACFGVIVACLLTSQRTVVTVVLAIIVAVVISKHYENIGRILKGEEKKFRFAKKESADS